MISIIKNITNNILLFDLFFKNTYILNVKILIRIFGCYIIKIENVIL